MALTVKDFAKTLKISDSALLERMQNAGLSHSKTVVILYTYNIVVVGLAICLAQDNATVSFFIAAGIATFLAIILLFIFRQKVRKE